MTIHIPIKLPSLANLRLHWRAMDRLKKTQKERVLIAILEQDTSAGRVPELPVIVTIKRIGKRRLDSDNNVISAKYVRDSIAKFYNVDDGSDQYEWRYEQEIAKEYGVEIRIEARTCR